MKAPTTHRFLGFTLLEMMLVIALIGIMATLAIPAYQDYMVRARVSEGMTLSMPARLAVHEYYSNYHALPENPNVLNFQAPEPTMNVSQVSIGSNGVIAVAYTAQAGNGTLLFTPSVKTDGRLTWCCDGGSLAPKYRPSMCKCR